MSSNPGQYYDKGSTNALDKNALNSASDTSHNINCINPDLKSPITTMMMLN
jgi:hypothetical protein